MEDINNIWTLYTRTLPGELEVADADDDITDIPFYLPDHMAYPDPLHSQGQYASLNMSIQPLPQADVMNNSYVRIVHTNGVHHLAMMCCTCHGADSILLDLVVHQLLLASFKRIQTLFLAQVLDAFHLSNLELKASTN